MQKRKNKLLIVLLFLLPGILFSKISKGPYLMAPTENSMTVMWECDSDQSATLIYWQNEEEKIEKKVESFDNRDELFLYRYEISDLKTNTEYFYSVKTNDDESPVSHFYTAVPKGIPYTFVAMGDSRSGHDTFEKVSELVSKENPKLIISMGDLIEHGNAFDEWGPNYFTPAKSMINQIPLISTLGDHETSKGSTGDNFFYYFRNGKDVEHQWFSYDYGDVHFVSLDFRGDKNPKMIEWFKNDMSKSNAKWKIVYLHRPTYNLGGHRSNWGNPVWQKLYSDYKVDIVFAGHSHIYERFYPLIDSDSKGKWAVTYITTGGAGAGLYDVVDNDFTAVAKSVNHYIVVNVGDNSLQLTAKKMDGSILDSFKISKNGKEQSKSYLAEAQPEAPLDIYMAFSGELELRVKENLKEKKFFTKEISFNSDGLKDDVNFTIHLSPESSKAYVMTPINGILKKDEKFKSDIEIRTKNKFIKRKKYFEPSLFLEVDFEYNGKKYTVPGAECRYYLP